MIPDVTEKIQGLRILGNRLEKSHETPFPVCRISYLQAKMYVRDKICLFSHHANMNMHTAATRQ